MQICLPTSPVRLPGQTPAFQCRKHLDIPQQKIKHTASGDFNGDGLTDLAVYQKIANDKHSWHICYSTGDLADAFVCEQETDVHGGGPENNVVGDFNGDGRTDMAARRHDGKWEVMYAGFGEFVMKRDVVFSSPELHNAVVGDFNGDGRQEIAGITAGNSNQHLHVVYSESDSIQVLSRVVRASTAGHVVNDYGTEVAFSYAYDTSPHKNSSYPITYISSPALVVNAVTTPNPVQGANNVMVYKYGRLSVHQRGLGMSSFDTIEVEDPMRGDRTVSRYHTDYPYTGMLMEQDTFKAKNRSGAYVKLKRDVSTFRIRKKSGSITSSIPADVNGLIDSHAPFFVHKDSDFGSTMSYQNGGILGVTTHTYRQGNVPGSGYDDFGNLTYLKTLTDDTKHHITWTSETRSTYYNNGANGRLKRAKVTHTSTAPEASIPVTKVSSFEYYNTGQLKAETVEDAAQNGSTAEKTQYLRTAYTYDVYGNETSVEHKGFKHNGQLEIRKITKTTDYIAANASGQPVKRVTTSNALNQAEVAEYHLNLGKQVYQRGANGFVTTWAFDEFGDHAVVTRHDGTQSKVVEHRFATASEANALPGAFSVLVTDTTGEPRATTFYNYDGQVRRSVTGALDPARRVYVDSEYDGLGRMVRQSRPYFDNQNPSHFATTIYQDMTTRPWRATSDDGTAVDYRYGDTWTSQSQVGTGRLQKTYSWFSGLAFEQREGTSNNYAVVKKRYDAAQRLTATIDDKGNRTSVAYDSRDRKIRQNDPDMGVWEYGYNSFGELAYQKDAKGQETINTHDVLGRLRRVANASGVTEYSFDYRLKGKGKLAKVSYAEPGQPAHYVQHIFYNQSHGRAEQINTCVGAGQAADCSNASLYKQVHKYDALGRLEYIRYPANQWLRHHYQQGRLNRLTLGSKTLWELNEQDASGQTRKVTHGNGLNTEYIYTAQQRLDKIAVLSGTTPTVLHSYSYQPADGLLATRTDHNLDTTETYTYDGYARIKTVKKDYGALSDTITYDYDSLGNLISKPDLASLQNVTIEYGTGTAGPHAVSGVGAREFTYDANGNLLDNGEQQLSWTAFNRPASITRGAHTTAFVYGPGNTRLQHIDGTKTTTYIGLYGGAGPFFEQSEDSASGSIEKRWYYRAGGRVITIGKQSGTTQGNWSWNSVRTERATKVIDDESGNADESSEAPEGATVNGH